MKTALALAVLAAILTLAGCQTADGSGNPFAPCPQGMHRIHTATAPPSKAWVCIGP